jgi:hypothetical protein
MKRVIIFSMSLLITAGIFGQQTSSPQLTREDYLKKSRHQKTAAWVLLGSGAVLFAIAVPGKVSFDILGPMVVVGAAATLGSIPLFIGSARNKRKGMAITGVLKMETDPFIHSPLMVSRAFPSIGVKMVFK